MTFLYLILGDVTAILTENGSPLGFALGLNFLTALGLK